MPKRVRSSVIVLAGHVYASADRGVRSSVRFVAAELVKLLADVQPEVKSKTVVAVS